MLNPATTPVIIGVGEHVDRPSALEHALEPLALMERAARAAERDSGVELLAQVDALEVVGFVSWRYQDPAASLCERLALTPARRSNASMGGETPVRLLHEAALRIASGQAQTTLIVGGEAMSSLGKARKQGLRLDWTPMADKASACRFANDAIATRPLARALGIREPAQMYPLYEMAWQAREGVSPAQGREDSARLWARYAQVAASNPNAWLRDAPDATAIATPSADNRPICWPYTKWMVANPNVNQASAILVTSLERALELGVAPEHLIYIWGGANASEPDDFLDRADHAGSLAQQAVLDAAVGLVGGAEAFDHIELYSCFPVVPKMALANLGLAPDGPLQPTVCGGLSFFGGPLNNYMGHAACSMVRALRELPEGRGLLYGQGGFVTKHQSLVLGRQAPAQALSPSASLQAQVDARQAPVPPVLDTYQGPARIETYTVLHGRDGQPSQGVLVLRTPEGARTLARVLPEDQQAMALLLSLERNAIGQEGFVHIDVFGKPCWRLSEQPQPAQYRFARVERHGHVTLVTIDRPEQMNALHRDANAELAQIFDDFARDPQQWVAIITGAGERAFSAGNDLKYTAGVMARGEQVEVPVTGFAGLTARFDLNKPVIAAVNGVALGGGFEIALACDLIVASSTATFALPEPKVGLAALAGGLLRLPQQVGLKQAMGMILTGRTVKADEALELGLVNQVVEPAALLPAAFAWAEQIVACSPMSIRASKEAVRLGQGAASLEQAYQAMGRNPATRALFRSPDVLEGPRAFAEKRAPRWTSN
ncbi:enoyl-CoA hydratase [Pseudomonas sp. S31]|uniref:enoyl-CoA hydratase-related protein n=1 Tax=Pseudomonas sp. S31 TaxID=1564473 RepID=UPI001F3CF779|nr:enoyl-CoA hydratase-related protein [Pseudomonas sp. S31]MBK4998768.1 enoyl-CoA hydratase [Pseudomonas sp. S31]